VTGASELSDDDDGKNDRLKWKLAKSVHKGNNIFTVSHNFKNSRVGRRIWICTDNGSG
jgi:hypothetical protein